MHVVPAGKPNKLTHRSVAANVKLPLSSTWPSHVSSVNVGKYHVDCYLGLLKYVGSLLPSVQFVQEVIKGTWDPFASLHKIL